MNDQRPTRWPCSADSSRKAGPAPRSLRKAETGVSQSSRKVCVTGTRLWRPASARTSSRPGRTPSLSSVSAPTATQHLFRVREAQAAAAQQDGEVVEHVGGLLGDALVGLLARRPGDLLRLLLDLGAGEGRVGEQAGGVGALGGAVRAGGDRAPQPGQHLVRRGRLELAAVEARALARVAGGAGGPHEREERVAGAVVTGRPDRLGVARRGALVPQL